MPNQNPRSSLISLWKICLCLLPAGIVGAGLTLLFWALDPAPVSAAHTQPATRPGAPSINSLLRSRAASVAADLLSSVLHPFSLRSRLAGAPGRLPGSAPLALSASPYCTPPLCLNWSAAENDYTYSVAWGDYDGDGDLDLAVGNYGFPPVRLYRNDGGTLTPAAVWSSAESDWTWSIAWGDYDGDGDLDLAVGNDCYEAGDTCSSVRLYRNDNGHLTDRAVWSSIEQDRAANIAWGDYNGDGKLDLAVVGFSSPNRLYRNDTTGLISSLTLMPWGNVNWGNGLAWGDVDGDGDLDLAISDCTCGTGPVALYRNDNGTLTSLPVWSSNLITATTSLAWGDMDGDGDLDLAVGSSDQPAAVFRNDTTNLTPTLTLVWRSAITERIPSVAWGDMDGDGDLDLAAGSYGQPNRLYRNDNGMLTSNPVWSSHEAGTTMSVAWGDVDGDGNLDLAAGNKGRFNQLYHNDTGLLTPQPMWSSTDAGVRTTSTAWGDYDGDGDLDLAAAQEQGGIRLYHNDNGQLTSSAVWTSTSTPTDWTYSLAWGDVDGDGNLDLAAGGSPTRVYRNDHGILIASPVYTSTELYQAVSVAWGDYDGDGDLDLAAGFFCGDGSDPNCRSVRLYRNDNGLLTPSAVFSSTETDNTYSVAWGDVDGDGDLDLATGTYGSGRPPTPNRLYRNDNGILTSSAVWSSNEKDATFSVAWGDYDGDGNLDLAAGNCCNQPTRLYHNDNGTLTSTAVWSSSEFDNNTSVSWIDYDGDGDLDLAVGNNGGPNRLYRNDHGVLTASAVWSSSETDSTYSVAWGDVDGDGDPDLVAGNWTQPNRLYRNSRVGASHLSNSPASVALAVTQPLFNANFDYTNPALRFPTIPMTYTVSDPEGDPVPLVRAYYSVNGGGQWDPAIAASNTLTSALTPRRYFNSTYLGPALPIPDIGLVTSTLAFTATAPFSATDVNVWVVLTHTQASDIRLVLKSPTGVTVTLLASGILTSPISQRLLFDDAADIRLISATVPYAGTYQPTARLGSFNGLNTFGNWTLQVEDTAAGNTGSLLAWGLQIQNDAGTYVYNWDTFASGFFGQSDNVVFRIEAYSSLSSGPSGVPVFQQTRVSAVTTPFRVRGTQVRVVNEDGTPATNAIVYRLPAGQNVDGALFRNNADAPFQTDSHGYLFGRGQIAFGDKLLALAPVLTSTQGYALYYTNGIPQEVGVNAFNVAAAGTQLLTVTAQHPLYLFDLDVSLEWDAHNDSVYLDTLNANLKRASQYLYDFTDGQMALGDVFVYQNTAAWDTSHIVIPANNRLRPFAAIGGIVFTDTTETAPAGPLAYSAGQVTIGSTWNRYGRPGQMLGDDWSAILAHELSHYLLYEDDVYLGLDGQGNVIPLNTCTGSAMGDLYDRPQNTEFIFDPAYWFDPQHCANTLANRTIGRTEWQTLRTWYPALITPTVSTALAGPSEMPYNLTTVTIFDPLTPTATLVDPTFYVNYAGTADGSTEARAYLFQSDAGGDWLLNLGSPTGGQSRIFARGAQPGDRLCVFDSPRAQFGCEIIEFGDDQLSLKEDQSWNPILQVTPVNSTTLQLSVTITPALQAGLTLQARVFPDRVYAPPTITLAYAGGVYSGTFALPDTGVTNGNLQLWVDEGFTETNPRRETLVAYSVGGNPGGTFAGGGSRSSGGIGGSRSSGGIGGSRSSGGIGGSRSSGGIGGSRSSGGIGQARSGHAPLLSPDGQMIFFTAANTEFDAGDLFAIQTAAGLPALPPGRTQVGPGYALTAAPDATLPPGSVSVQYLSNDVTQAGAIESDLSLYFYNDTSWIELSTTVAPDSDLAVAQSQGPGLYALLASIQIQLPALGWNNIGYPLRTTQPITNALASIFSKYTLAYSYVPTDPLNPWKVYSPAPIPGYVNELQEMQPGQGYWIYATVTTTLYLAPADIDTALAGLTPPTTFYGSITGTADFTPTAGQSVAAVVNGLVCGQGVTQDYAGAVVYSVDVNADSGGAVPDCGRPGQNVTFYVKDERMGPLGVWNNTDLAPLNLAPSDQQEKYVYLPLVRR